MGKKVFSPGSQLSARRTSTTLRSEHEGFYRELGTEN